MISSLGSAVGCESHNSIFYLIRHFSNSNEPPIMRASSDREKKIKPTAAPEKETL